MKKRMLSVLLVMVMVFSAFPLVSSAATETVLSGQTKTISVNTTIASGDSWSVANGGKIVINEGITLTIASGASIFNDGTIENKGKIIVNGSLVRQDHSVIKHEVRLPAGKTNQYTVYSLIDDIVLDPTDIEYDPLYMNDSYNYDAVPSTEGLIKKVWVTEGQPFYFRITLALPDYDVNKFPVNANGVPLTYRMGTFLGLASVSNSVDISYGTGNGPVYGEYLRKTIRISLPGTAESGYQVVAYYNGKDYVQEVEVAYGSGFAFAIRLDPEYDKSNYTVTVGGVKATKNDDGFYTVNNVTDEKAAAKAYEIVVAGVMTNEMMNTFSSIIAFIKQIVETLKDVFGTFFGMIPGTGTQTT